MPTSGRKACLLLKEGKVSIYRKLPFTIKLNYKTGNTTQPGFLGIDVWEDGEVYCVGLVFSIEDLK